jgi:protein phosphatase 2C family protein 2/3
MDHKPFVESEMKRIIAAGGRIQSNRINNRLTLSRALGDFSFKNNKSLKASEQLVIAYPDICFQNLTDDYEFIIMACDGVWDVLTNEKALEFVRTRVSQSIPPENV